MRMLEARLAWEVGLCGFIWGQPTKAAPSMAKGSQMKRQSKCVRAKILNPKTDELVAEGELTLLLQAPKSAGGRHSLSGGFVPDRYTPELDGRTWTLVSGTARIDGALLIIAPMDLPSTASIAFDVVFQAGLGKYPTWFDDLP
jgi:hypothetical protein